MTTDKTDAGLIAQLSAFPLFVRNGAHWMRIPGVEPTCAKAAARIAELARELDASWMQCNGRIATWRDRAEKAEAALAASAKELAIAIDESFAQQQRITELDGIVAASAKDAARLAEALHTIAALAPGNGDVCEIIAKRSRDALAQTEEPRK